MYIAFYTLKLYVETIKENTKQYLKIINWLLDKNLLQNFKLPWMQFQNDENEIKLVRN